MSQSPPGSKESYSDTLRRLASAQKSAARSAPAYSRFVNRRLGRLIAAWAWRAGLSANAVTLISAVLTATGIALIVLVPPSWTLGAIVAACLVLGYAFDSADGQVARLAGTSGPAGEWLDHMVDAAKVSALPLAVAVAFYRFDLVDRAWLVVPLAAAVVGAVLFFGMILTEQLRRAHGVVSLAATEGRLPWLRSVVAIPTDYGLLCLSFALLGSPRVFFAVYTVITAATAGFLLLASVKWRREIAGFAATPSVGAGEIPVEARSSGPANGPG